MEQFGKRGGCWHERCWHEFKTDGKFCEISFWSSKWKSGEKPGSMKEWDKKAFAKMKVPLRHLQGVMSAMAGVKFTLNKFLLAKRIEGSGLEKSAKAFLKGAEWLLNKALEPRIPYLPLDCEMGRLWNPSEGEALEARKAVRELEKRYLFRIICEDRETGETVELGPEDGVPWRK